MNKKNWIISFISLLFAFFLNGYEGVTAEEITIIKYPSASDIYYGQPLFSSKLEGGTSNIEGVFSWKNSELILNSGTYNQVVVFTPLDNEFDCVEFNVNINVLKRKVYLAFEDKLRKIYDGSDSINLPGYFVRGIIDENVYVSGNIVAKLDKVFPGNNIKVNISGLEIKGDEKNNYYLDLNGIYASVFRENIETFGSVKNKVEFTKNTYVPYDSTLYVGKIDSSSFSVENHRVKSTYIIEIINNDKVLDIGGEVYVKLKIEEEDIGYKRLKIYNYYNGEYEEVSYSYKDGYLSYVSRGLGKLVITTKNIDLTGLYIVFVLSALVGVSYLGYDVIKSKDKVCKYKSLKRGKDYGNN